MSEELNKLKTVLEETALKQTTVTTDLLLRVTALENLLIESGIVSKEDFQQKLKNVAEQLKEALTVGLKESTTNE